MIIISEKFRHQAYERWLKETKEELRPKGRAYLEDYMKGVGPVKRFLYDFGLLRSPIRYDATKSLLEEIASQNDVSLNQGCSKPANCL